MPHSQWSLQDAKNKFSTVVDAAHHGHPQTVTKHGVPTVVIISTKEFERLQHLEQSQSPNFNEHLLSMPTDDGEFERVDITARDMDL
jgi:antitoxin Phd